jgi:nucleotide-binding universal stress UspA family protein
MQETASGNPIVVGYDGSLSGDRALRWALGEGTRLGLPVHVVHVVEWPVTAAPGAVGWLSDEDRLAARSSIDRAIAWAGGDAQEVSVVEGSIVGTLCDLSQKASMTVVGSRGAGGFSGLLIGSVSLAVTMHAASPVIVVRGEEHVHIDEYPVVAGLDDSDPAKAAAAFAFAEAASRGCGLVALRAWQPVGPVRDPEELETAERHALREVLEPHRTRHPGVPVTTRLAAGSPGKALIEASSEAQLVVVGARGMGGFRGLLLGSAGQQLVHHAHCPVAVVR